MCKICLYFLFCLCVSINVFFQRVTQHALKYSIELTAKIIHNLLKSYMCKKKPFYLIELDVISALYQALLTIMNYAVLSSNNLIPQNWSLMTAELFELFHRVKG